MIPAPIKHVFSRPTCSVVLCLLALFLIGNTFYLSTIRDRKADTVEAIGQKLDDYQAGLEHFRHTGLPEALTQNFHYGAFLKIALENFKTDGQDIIADSMRLDKIEVNPANSANPANRQSSTLSSTSHKKKQTVQQVFRLEISGHIPASSEKAPYNRLNDAIARIQTETGCQFILHTAGETTGETTGPEQKTPEIPHLTFKIRLIPAEQPACIRQFSGSL